MGGWPRKTGRKYEYKFPTLAHGFPWRLASGVRFSGAVGSAGALLVVDGSVNGAGIEGGFSAPRL